MKKTISKLPEKRFEIDQDMKEIARILIKKFPKEFKKIDIERVLFIREIKEGQSKATAECLPMLTFGTEDEPLYVIIVYYSANWESLTLKQKEILLLHQLLHISPDFNGEVRKHDVEDFLFILQHFGFGYIARNKLIPCLID